MSDRQPENGHSPRLIRALTWAGAGLAPVAALLVLLGGDGAERVSIVLIAVCAVLLGASQLIRTDPVLLRMHVEDRVADEIGALREELRAELAAARSAGPDRWPAAAHPGPRPRPDGRAVVRAAPAPVSTSSSVGRGASVGFASSVSSASVGSASVGSASVGAASVGSASSVGPASVGFASSVGHAPVGFASSVGSASVGASTAAGASAVVAAPVHASVAVPGQRGHRSGAVRPPRAPVFRPPMPPAPADPDVNPAAPASSQPYVNRPALASSVPYVSRAGLASSDPYVNPPPPASSEPHGSAVGRAASEAYGTPSWMTSFSGASDRRARAHDGRTGAPSGAVFGATRGGAVAGTYGWPVGEQRGRRRADETAVDLGYTGRRSKPDHASHHASEDDEEVGLRDGFGFGDPEPGYPGWAEAENRYGGW